MLLPNLNKIRSSSSIQQDFKGLNHKESIPNNQFYEMKNLTSDLYPVLASRKPRGTVRHLSKPNGLCDKNALAWVDGSSFYYDGVVKGTVSDTPKQFASMGAYILIFPDKKYYNTADGIFGSLENSFYATGSVSVVGSDADGNTKDIASSVYIKISASGIGDGFKKIDGVTISGCNISEVNKTAVIQYISSNFIVIIGTLTRTGSQSGGLSVSRDVPNMEYFTESENRLWGCNSSKHEIYASKLGDPFNWNCYEGISTDSYAVTVGTDGDFTGAYTYLGHVLFFKEDCIHKVYGSKPSNFQIYNTPCRGVAKGSEKSIVLVNETLYYLSRNGVVVYAGGLPESVSNELGEEKYIDGVAGSYGDKYYISMKDTNSTWHLFTFNEKLGIWNKEDNTQVLYFTNYEGVLYYVDSSNRLMTIEGNDQEVIEWYAEFGDTADYNLMKKYISRLQFRLELEANSTFEIRIQYDSSGVWNTVTSLTGDKNKVYTIPIITKRCDHYRIRLNGTGAFKLYAIVKVTSEGSDI
jgi:hypothetical protein